MTKTKTKKTNKHTSHAKKSLLKGPVKGRPAVALLVALLLVITGIFIVYRSLAAANTMYLTPTSQTVALGSSFTVTIREDSGTDAINAVQADLTFDATKFSYVSSNTTINTNFSGSNGTCLAPQISTGSVKIACAKYGAGITGDQAVASVTFTAIGTGSTPMAFATTSAIVRASDQANILLTRTGATYNITDQNAPTSPGTLSAPTRTINSIALSWGASTDNVGVVNYRVYRCPATCTTANRGTAINSPTGTSYTNTGLSPNTTYFYGVDAVDAAGNASTMTTGSFLTLPDTTAPTTPTALAASTRTVTSIALSWTASTDNVAVTGYRVYVCPAACTTANRGTAVTTTASTGYTRNGLSPNTSYNFGVDAIDAAGNASTMATGSFLTLPDTNAPSVPTGLISTGQTTNSISLSWAASTDNVAVTGYRVYRDGTQIGTPTSTSFTDTGLTQGTAYSYTVSAVDAAGNASAQTAASSFTTISKPGDVNSDGSVGILDLSILATNYNLSGRTRAEGDLNGNGVVDIFDFSILALNWGT